MAILATLRLPRVTGLVLALVCGLGMSPALAQGFDPAQLQPPDVLDLKLGEAIAAQPGPFREFACGTNGGPPAQALGGFADFQKCQPEAGTGLREVSFRYDDELEYYALAMNLKPIADRYGGTRFGSFPVIVSALIDDAGIIRGYRVVTDDRVSLRERRVAYMMGILAKSRIKGAWTCTDLGLGDGETAVGRAAVKEDCTGTSSGGNQLFLATRYYHRRGQTALDPHSGRLRDGLFESTARLEVLDAEWKKP